MYGFIDVWIYVFVRGCICWFVVIYKRTNIVLWVYVFVEMWKSTNTLCSLSALFVVYRNIHAFLFSYPFRSNGQDAILSLHSGACHGGVGREGIVFARAILCTSCLNICIRWGIVAQYTLLAQPVTFGQVRILHHLRSL